MKISLNDSQLRVLSDIGIACGQLSAAGMVLPFVVLNLDVDRLPVVILGLLFTIGSWFFSVIIARRIKG